MTLSRTRWLLLLAAALGLLFLVPQAQGQGRELQSVPSEQIRTAALHYLRGYLPWPAGSMKIRNVFVPPGITAPVGKVSLGFSEPPGGKALGTLPIPVRLLVNGNVVRRFTVLATVDAFRSVLVAARPIGRGQVLEAGDVLRRRLRIRELPPNALDDASLAVGKVARQTLRANEVLTGTVLESPPVVYRGDVVLLVAESRDLRVSAPGRALENGAEGEEIRVFNLSSRKQVYGRVRRDGTVLADY